MGEYQVIARKWRPQRFADVVGQEHIVQTLRNAIMQKRTAHAYLFVGPRGIGKTTTARIFAKAMNCEAPEAGEPCCKCRSCLAMAAENNIDIIEIDAASQNSVDNIRDLRDEVLHVPVNSKYKIYIIDEVHMLSKQAWNALLKTIEEPPAHAKFIFATTEVHMVLPTIISRCQRFDLQRISTNMIAERLNKIASSEKVNITPAAIAAIARAADGGMRDAQSLLDQMIAFFSANDGSGISEEQALSLFGLTSANDLQVLLQAILANRRDGVVTSIYQLAEKGKNLETLFNDILAWLRGVQLTKILRDPQQVLEIDRETAAAYAKLGEGVNLDTVQAILETLSPVGRILHDALNKQVYLETIILKAMREAHAIKIEQLIARLNTIRAAGELEIIEQIPAVENSAPLLAATPAPKMETVEKQSSIQPKPVSDIQSSQPEPGLAPTTAMPQFVPAPAEDIIEIGDMGGEETETNQWQEVENCPSAVTDPISAIASSNASETPEARDYWHQVIATAQSFHRLDPIICGYLREAAAIRLDGDSLIVVYDEEFESAHVAAVEKHNDILCRCWQDVRRAPDAKVKIILQHGINETGSARKMRSIITEASIAAAKNNPHAKVICDLFTGEIVDIHG